MRMVFTADEVADILKSHMREKLGIEDQSVGGVRHRIKWDQASQTHVLDEVSVDVATDGGVPRRGGPYRSPGAKG